MTDAEFDAVVNEEWEELEGTRTTALENMMREWRNAQENLDQVLLDIANREREMSELVPEESRRRFINHLWSTR